jgi:hypothetical protein
MTKWIGVVVLALAVVGLALPTPAAYAGPPRSSQSDQPSSNRAFSITNNSSCTITFTIRTGNGKTDELTLAPGRGAAVSYGPNSKGQFLKPQISFRAEVGGKTDTFYDLDDSPVTDGQTGPVGTVYEFKDTGRNTIDLFKQ